MLEKTNKLTGAALDWAVAKCEGMEGAFLANPYSYSTNWIFGGPIIEREKLDVFCSDVIWGSAWDRHPNVVCTGETPLIAAMRCYAASKLGGEIEIPKELTNVR
jgi:hypothetical protein